MVVIDIYVDIDEQIYVHIKQFQKAISDQWEKVS